MTKIILPVFIGLVCLLNLACQSATSPNANANAANTATNIDPKDMPPGLSTAPITPSGNSTPGISDTNSMNANVPPKGATPTPGIPDPKDAGKPLPKGATPTPGIPDPETLKKQANRQIQNTNSANPSGTDANLQASGSEDRPRTVRKP